MYCSCSVSLYYKNYGSDDIATAISAHISSLCMKTKSIKIKFPKQRNFLKEINCSAID